MGLFKISLFPLEVTRMSSVVISLLYLMIEMLPGEVRSLVLDMTRFSFLFLDVSSLMSLVGISQLNLVISMLSGKVDSLVLRMLPWISIALWVIISLVIICQLYLLLDAYSVV